MDVTHTHMHSDCSISFVRFCPGDPEIWCGFDNSICDFIQDVEDDSDWELGSGDTSDPQTGPSGDHTTQSGKVTGDSYSLYNKVYKNEKKSIVIVQ